MRRSLVALAVCFLAATGCDRAATPASPSPSEPATPAPSASLAPTTSPIPSPPPGNPQGSIDLRTRPAPVPPEFRYIESWPGRLLLLDLAKRSATEIATYTARAVEPGYPGAQLSASVDGRTLLVLVRVSATDSTLFVLKPQSGESRVLVRGATERALISADGSRFAIARHNADRGLTGLWVGTIADGAMHRLIADDPQLVGAPPVPFAFSSDGQLLAFGLGTGDSGYRAGVLAVSSAEVDAARLRDPNVTTAGVALLGAGSGAEFRSANEVFVWSSRSAFGGQTVAYVYDLSANKQTELYSPTADLLSEAAWRPNTEQFATLEQPSCCGVGIPRTPWLRGRDGAAKKLLEPNAFIGQIWWSSDGSKLYAIIGGDDSTGGVLELLSGQAVMPFCKRGGVAPGPCT